MPNDDDDELEEELRTWDGTILRPVTRQSILADAMTTGILTADKARELLDLDDDEPDEPMRHKAHIMGMEIWITKDQQQRIEALSPEQIEQLVKILRSKRGL